MANEKGTFSNPYTYEEYQNLHTKGKWHGGHVLYNGKIYYYNSNGILSSDDCDGCGSGSSSGCGCGCGCGSGCGCGCGCGCGGGYFSGASIQAGQVIIRSELPVNMWITLSWESGTFNAINLPGISATLYTEANNGETMSIQIVVNWVTDYHAVISCFPTISYIIPSQYREGKA